MKEVKSIPNAHRTFEALRSMGYDLKSSIADVIDNAITPKVGATKVDVFIRLNYAGKIVCRILDNGSGMSNETLQECMRIGAETNYQEGDLGKFGMGMKTASLAHCNKLTVISGQNGCERNAYRWDLDKIKEHKEWNLLQLSTNEIKEYLRLEKLDIGTSGTAIYWDDMFLLDNNYRSYKTEKGASGYLAKEILKVMTHLSVTYHKLLSAESKLQIRINEAVVEPWDAYCSNEEFSQEVRLDDAQKFLHIPGYEKPIIIRGFVVPTRDQFSSKETLILASGGKSWNDTQGYYIYRSERLIDYGGWHGMKSKDEHDKLARISIEIDSSLDDLFSVNVNKSKVIFPELLKEHLRMMVNKPVLKIAKATYRKTSGSSEVKNKIRSNKKVEGISNELITESKITSRVSDDGSQEDPVVIVNNPSGEWASNPISDFLKYGDSSSLKIVSDDLGLDTLWKIVCDDNDQFRVIINSSHPFYEKVYLPTRNRSTTAALDLLIFSLAFSELRHRSEETNFLFKSYHSTSCEVLSKLVTTHKLL